MKQKNRPIYAGTPSGIIGNYLSEFRERTGTYTGYLLSFTLFNPLIRTLMHCMGI